MFVKKMNRAQKVVNKSDHNQPVMKSKTLTLVEYHAQLFFFSSRVPVLI